MSWLCDFCGYENEWDEKTQSTVCLCCGEMAPKEKILKARQELNVRRREEKHRTYLEKRKRVREFGRQKVDGIIGGVSRMARAMSFIMAVVTIIAIVWCGVFLYSQNVVLEIFSTLSENVRTKCEVCIDHDLDSVKRMKASLSKWNECFDGGMALVVENIGKNLKQIGEQIPDRIQNIGNSFSYGRINGRIFWNRAKRNVQEFIAIFT